MIDTNEIRSRANMYEWTDEEVLSLCDEIDRLRGEKQTPPQDKPLETAIVPSGRDDIGESEWDYDPSYLFK